MSSDADTLDIAADRVLEELQEDGGFQEAVASLLHSVIMLAILVGSALYRAGYVGRPTGG